MKRPLKSFFFLFSLFFLFSSVLVPLTEARERKKKTPKIIESETGLKIPEWGVAIDAVYNPELDSLLPGYKILNVVITNHGSSIIRFDMSRDRWMIHDNVGRERRATNHLRLIDEKLWDVLPVGLKDELEYPQLVRVGNTTKIDLLFPASTDLYNFRDLMWESSYFKKTFRVYTAVEKNLKWESKEEPAPGSEAIRQSMQKYEGMKQVEDPRTVNPDAAPVIVPKPEEKERNPLLDENYTLPMD